MNSEDRILRALQALQQADREREAPAAVEARLLTEFRARLRQPGSRIPRRISWPLAATLAAAAMAVLLLRLHYTRPEIHRASAPRTTAPVARVEQAPTPVQSKAAPVRKRVAAAIPEPPGEIVTDFFPLMDVAPPLGRGQLLRVAVPASTMRSVGLPVREERLNEPVQADVLLGEEGMVRAIRFVSQRN
jgi:hypothetical protein